MLNIFKINVTQRYRGACGHVQMCTGRDAGAAMNKNAKLGFASTSHNFRYIVEIVIQFLTGCAVGEMD